MRRATRILFVAAGIVIATTVAASSGGARVSGSCSSAIARRLIQTLPISRDAQPFNGGLGQFICIDFTGDRRPDIVLSVWTAMNHGAHYWAAFRGTSGRHWHPGRISRRLLRRLGASRRHGYRHWPPRPEAIRSQAADLFAYRPGLLPKRRHDRCEMGLARRPTSHSCPQLEAPVPRRPCTDDPVVFRQRLEYSRCASPSTPHLDRFSTDTTHQVASVNPIRG